MSAISGPGQHAFGVDIDFAQLVKLYGEDPEPQKRYYPAKNKGTERDMVQGDPDHFGVLRRAPGLGHADQHPQVHEAN